MSEYNPSPRRQIDSDYKYMNKINKESQKISKTGVNNNNKMMHFSNASTKLDLLNVSVGNYGAEEG